MIGVKIKLRRKVSEDKKCAWNTYYSIQILSEAYVWYDLKSNTTIEQLMKIVVPNENE